MSKRPLSGADGIFGPSSSANKGDDAGILGTFECSNSHHTFDDVARGQHIVRSKNIICGRGLHVSCHHGNLNLHRIADRYRQTYLASPRRDKSTIVRQIIHEIKSTGAKFIRRVDGGTVDAWVEVDYKTAYTKVSHALRLRRPFSGQNNAQSALQHEVAAPSSISQHEMSHQSRLSTLPSIQSQLMSPMSIGQSQLMATLAHPQSQRPHILGDQCRELPSNYVLFAKVYAMTLSILTQTIHQQVSGQGQVSISNQESKDRTGET